MPKKVADVLGFFASWSIRRAQHQNAVAQQQSNHAQIEASLTKMKSWPYPKMLLHDWASIDSDIP